MALRKEPYGLVYNDDGTLCTTYRDDDVPFRGVRSFAVETATTNLVTNSPQQPSFHLQSNAQATRSIVTSGNLAGWVKINVTKIGAWGIVGNFGRQVHEPDETKTYSIDCVSLPNGWQLEVTGDYDSGVLFKRSEYRYDRTWTNTIGSAKNQGIFIRTNLPEGTTGSWDVYVRNYQIEQKSYATSFVDGSRPAGQLNIDKNEIGFFGTPNHVFNFWIKNRWLKEQEFFESIHATGFVIAEFQHGGTNGAMDGYYDSVIFINKNSRIVYFKTANGTSVPRYTIFNQEDYADGEWIMLTVIFDSEGTSSCYVNGELKATGSIAYPLKNRIPDVKFFCNSYPYAKMYSSLISNIYIGKYRRPDGTVIWTDDYIREVYEAQIPFPTSNKLSIY